MGSFVQSTKQAGRVTTRLYVCSERDLVTPPRSIPGRGICRFQCPAPMGSPPCPPTRASRRPFCFPCRHVAFLFPPSARAACFTSWPRMTRALCELSSVKAHDATRRGGHEDVTSLLPPRPRLRTDGHRRSLLRVARHERFFRVRARGGSPAEKKRKVPRFQYQRGFTLGPHPKIPKFPLKNDRRVPLTGCRFPPPRS